MSNEIWCVYIHISPNNKRYIGITSQEPNKRWRRDGKGYKSNTYFYRAINKYGWDNFQHIIIARGLNEETAKWLEIELIREWDSTNKDKGYNINIGGEGCNGIIFSEETRKKMSENHADFSGENHPQYGTHRSEETKQKISKANSGKTWTEEHKQEQSERMSGENNPMYDVHRYGKDNPRAKSVINLTTKRIFFTAKEGAEFYNIKGDSNISSCCKGKLKSSGKLKDGTKLVWRYLVHKHDIVLRGSDISKLHKNKKEVA